MISSSVREDIQMKKQSLPSSDREEAESSILSSAGAFIFDELAEDF